jgi:hypothetical protein
VNEPVEHNSGVPEDVWRAWVEKGKQRDRAAARKMRTLAGVVLLFLIIVLVFYISWVK